MDNNGPNDATFHRSDSTDLQLRLQVMAHTGTIPSFQRRTADSARQLRDNVIREIQPLVETARTVNAGVQNAISITSFLNRTPSSEHASHQNPSNQEDSIVINLEDISIDNNQLHSPNNVRQADHQPEEAFVSNNNNPDDNVDRSQNILETQQSLQSALKYVPFVLILFAKAVYDYHEGIFILLILLTTFVHTNSAVKKETVKRHRRSLMTLLIELLYILACSVFLYFCFADDIHKFDVVMNIVLIRTFPLTVSNLLWIVIVTDFVLKLITVTVKILLTMLPGWIVPFQKRGKIYFFIEALSQMYRSIATIQPWLNFLMESYQGTEKVVAVFLSGFYMMCKGTDLMSRLKLLKTATLKLLQNVTVGSSPSKEQIQTAGEHCPICHDNYDAPVLLQCRHIFCENCVTTWFDREQTCPLCRAKIVDDPKWRDGSTSFFLQLY